MSATKAPNPVRDFLGEFALAVHRYLIYPADHPLLGENAQKVVEVLAPVPTNGESVDLVIAGGRIVIADRADEGGPSHQELATKLRDLGIGAIRISPSSDVEDVQALLSFLRDRSKAGESTLDPGTEVPGTTAIEVRPVSFAGLEISWDEEERGVEQLVQLWVALDSAVTGRPATSSSAFIGQEGGGTQEDPDSEVRSVERIANGLRASVESPAGSALAVGYLRQLLRAVGGASSRNTQVSLVRRRLRGLIGALDPDTIRELASATGATTEQASFVADISLLGDEAVARVLKAVANPNARSLTDSLARLFGKMASQGADEAGNLRAETQRALRRSLLELLKEWALEDPNPTEYGTALDRISRSLQGLGSEWTLEGGNEPERLLQMSMELSAYGPVVERAAEYLLFNTAGGLTTLVRLIEDEDPANVAVREIARLLEDPDRILSLADAEDVEEETLRSIVERMGSDAIPPLIEVLARAESRAIRRKVFDTLVSLGDEAAEAGLRKLPDDRWYFTRNLLSLARKAGYHFPWFDPDPYLEAPEGTIRREAYRLAYLDPKRRTQALADALNDTEDRIVFEALAELEHGVPSLIARALSPWASDDSRSDQVRIGAIRALGNSRAPVVLKALIAAASYKTRFLRRRKIRKPNGIVSTAVHVLAEQWNRNPEARIVLALAAKAGIDTAEGEQAARR
ncbi:MAG: hypothetical protein OEO23_06740 [Gemmatimonadota bacterium]|nr:hypothetical protein [Gemmatimonadota bacterium]